MSEINFYIEHDENDPAVQHAREQARGLVAAMLGNGTDVTFPLEIDRVMGQILNDIPDDVEAGQETQLLILKRFAHLITALTNIAVAALEGQPEE